MYNFNHSTFSTNSTAVSTALSIESTIVPTNSTAVSTALSIESTLSPVAVAVSTATVSTATVSTVDFDNVEISLTIGDSEEQKELESTHYKCK